MSKRSLGVTLLAVFTIFSGVTGIFDWLGAEMMVLQADQTLNVDTLRQKMQQELAAMPNQGSIDLDAMLHSDFFQGSMAGMKETVHSWKYRLANMIVGVLSLASLWIGVGIFRLREWARKGMVYFQWLNVPLFTWAMYLAFQTFYENMSPHIKGIAKLGPYIPLLSGVLAVFLLLSALLIMWYLNKPKIREQFI